MIVNEQSFLVQTPTKLFWPHFFFFFFLLHFKPFSHNFFQKSRGFAHSKPTADLNAPGNNKIAAFTMCPE